MEKVYPKKVAKHRLKFSQLYWRQHIEREMWVIMRLCIFSHWRRKAKLNTVMWEEHSFSQEENVCYIHAVLISEGSIILMLTTIKTSRIIISKNNNNKFGALTELKALYGKENHQWQECIPKFQAWQHPKCWKRFVELPQKNDLLLVLCHS